MNKNGYNLKRKRLKTYRIKSVQWKTLQVPPNHNITLPTNKFYVQEPTNQEPRVPLKPMKQRTHKPTRNINSSEDTILKILSNHYHLLSLP